MGMMDKAKELRDKVAASGKLDEYADKAQDKVGDVTEHRFDDQLDQGADAAKEAARKAGGPRDQADSMEQR